MSSRTCIGSFAVAAALASLLARPAAAALLQVPEDHATIATALAAASAGDTVSIAPGIYYEHDLVLPTGVSVHGRTGIAETVVIDAQGLGRVLYGAAVDERTTLAFFTARNGNSQGWPGAGLHLFGKCYLHDLVVEDCAQSGTGVGAYCVWVLLIEDCVFRNNDSPHQDSQGGGLYVVPIPPPGGTQIRRVDFIGNRAHLGAALHVSGRPILVEEIRVFDNQSGAAVYFYDGEAGGGTTVFLENSIIANNEAGVYVDADARIRGCTIVGCTWGGIYAGATWDHPKWVEVENCIVAFNGTAAGGNGIDNWDEPWTAVYCSNVYKNLPANYAGMPDPTGLNGNLSVDPGFCADAGPEAYPLRKDSPCAPANNSCGLLMGAFPVGCDATAVEETSWSRIKSLY